MDSKGSMNPEASPSATQFLFHNARRWPVRAERQEPGHDHELGNGHSHGLSTDADRRYLVIALCLLGAFMLGEVIVAFASGSLALLSDAGHMLSDIGAIAGALWAIRLAARPPAGSWTFGWKRAEILSAAGNGITLLVVSGSSRARPSPG